VLATLPGTTVLYYGDEIGMTDVAVPPELRRDNMSRRADERFIRDRGRTPMPWEPSPSAGFTADGVKPWLPVGDAAARNVADQRRDPGSVLSFCAALLALRRAELGGQVARYEVVSAAGGLWCYRVGGLTVAANFSDTPAAVPGPVGETLLRTGGELPSAAGTLAPWEGIVTRRAA
jgi:alpha-glucosidase